uniref:Uncharacterized protein n=1 Tax=Anguilla anguilla TaxID=7936 RepID=A0A0E9XQV9_ANGAN
MATLSKSTSRSQIQHHARKTPLNSTALSDPIWYTFRQVPCPERVTSPKRFAETYIYAQLRKQIYI